VSKYVDVGFLRRAGQFGQQFLRFLLADSRFPAKKANKASLGANKFTINGIFVGLFTVFQQFSQHLLNGGLPPAKVA